MQCQDDFPSENGSGSVSLEDTTEKLVVSAIGSFSSCDVWFRVPRAWRERVILKLYGRMGRARVLLRAVRLISLELTEEELHYVGLALSLRSQPVRSFELACVATTGDPLEGGVFYLNAWADAQGASAAAAGPGEGGAPRVAVTARLLARTESGDLTPVAATDDGVVRTIGVRP